MLSMSGIQLYVMLDWAYVIKILFQCFSIKNLFKIQINIYEWEVSNMIYELLDCYSATNFFLLFFIPLVLWWLINYILLVRFVRTIDITNFSSTVASVELKLKKYLYALEKKNWISSYFVDDSLPMF